MVACGSIGPETGLKGLKNDAIVARKYGQFTRRLWGEVCSNGYVNLCIGSGNSMIERPESPCVEVCTLDARAGFCTGCGRTIAEIGEWSGATAERQRAILNLLPDRMAQIAAGHLVTR